MSGRFHKKDRTKVRKVQRHLDKQQWIRRRLNGRNYLGKKEAALLPATRGQQRCFGFKCRYLSPPLTTIRPLQLW